MGTALDEGALRPQQDELPDAKPSLRGQANSHDVEHMPQHVFSGQVSLSMFLITHIFLLEVQC